MSFGVQPIDAEPHDPKTYGVEPAWVVTAHGGKVSRLEVDRTVPQHVCASAADRSEMESLAARLCRLVLGHSKPGVDGIDKSRRRFLGPAAVAALLAPRLAESRPSLASSPATSPLAAADLIEVEQRGVLKQIDAAHFLSGMDASTSLVTSAWPGAAPRTQAARASEVINVLDWSGFDIKGMHDNTAALREAAAQVPVEGGVIELPAGTILLSDAIPLRSLTTVRGKGRATRLFASPTWPDQSPSAQADRSSGNCFFQNLNYAAPTITDRDITIQDLCFDYGAYLVASAHTLGFRMMRRLQILNCFMLGGDSGTSILASDDVLTMGCSLQGQQTGLDHWEGCTNVRVIGNSVVLTQSVGTGIQVSGTGTLVGSTGTSTGIVIAGNVVVGNPNTSTGITFNALAEGSAVTDGLIVGNRIRDAAIYIDGPCDAVVVVNNVLSGANSGIHLRGLSGGGKGPVTNSKVADNLIRGANIPAFGVGPISVDGSGNDITFNRIAGGSWNVGIWLTPTSSGNQVIGNNVKSDSAPANGSTVAYQDNGTNNTVVDYLGRSSSASWTPAIKFDSNLPIAQSGSGTYYRQGNVVTIQGAVTLTKVGRPKGAINVRLPIPAARTSGLIPIVVWIYHDRGASAGTPGLPCFVSGDGESLHLTTPSGDGFGSDNFVDGSIIQFAGTYLVA
jgi:hypothetical protein